MSLQLRPYQERVIEDLREGFRQGHKRQILQMATGAGKTAVAAAIADYAKSNDTRTLFVVSKLVLIDQAWMHFEALGLRVGLIQGENTTYRPDDDVVIASIQTLDRRDYPSNIGLIIVDEVHELHEGHKKLMDAWNALPVIGLSATPMRDGLGKYFTNMVRGPSIKELTDEGFLVPTRAWCPSEEILNRILEQVRIVRGEFASEELSDNLNSKQLIGDIVTTYQDKAEDRQALCFAVDIAHSKSIVDEFLAHGVPACHIDGKMDQDERENILSDFRRGEYRVLSSVYVLGVGFDYPDVSCAILARPTLSHILHIQQLGRVLRPADGKEYAIILDHSGNTVRFGLPEHFEVPDLNDQDRKTARQKRQEKKLTTCKCGYVLEPGQQTCPGCGIDRPVKSADVVSHDGNLVEFGSGDSSDVFYTTTEDKIRFYCELKWLAENSKTGNINAAAHWYKAKFGSWPPWEWRSMASLEPGPQARNWKKSQSIRFRKSMEKQKKPKPPRTECQWCGSKNLYRGESVAHPGGSLNCGDCGRHVQWLPKDAG